MAHNDINLTKRIGQGERRAFEEFVDRFGATIHRLVRRYASNEADAEDLTQEIFLDLYRSASGFRGESSLATWIYRVALNHCLRYRERCGPATESYDELRHEPEDRQADPARQAARHELSSQVQVALHDLTDAHRDVVILHELHGLTYQECALVLDVPVGTVKSRLANAFRRLRGSLGNYVLGDATNLRPDAIGETL